MRNKILKTITLLCLLSSPFYDINAAVENQFKFYLFKSEGLTDELFLENFSKPKFDYPLRKFENPDSKSYTISASAIIENSTFYNSYNTTKNNRFVASNRVLFNFGENISFYNEMVFDQELADDPFYTGKVWRNNLAGFTKAAFGEYRKDFLTVRFGVYPTDIGVSNFDNLLFSETVEGFSKLQMNFTFDKFSFSTFVGKLNDENRNISMHRVKYTPNRYFNISLIETVIYGGDMQFKYANPFTFYHGVQLNDQQPANTLGSFEVESYLNDNFRLYGSFLLDDYQFDNKERGDLEPNEIGWAIGCSWKNFYFKKDLLEYEYSGITNRTFNTSDSTGIERFMLGKKNEIRLGRGEYLGNKLGNDFDIHRIKYVTFLKKDKISFSFAYLRCGEGSPRNKWDTPWMEYSVDEGYSESFPTGNITLIASYKTEYKKTFSKYLEVYTYFNYLETMNEDDELEVGLKLKLNLNYLDI